MTVNNTVPPTVTGRARVGDTLSTTNGEWTFDLDYLEYDYQWMRCDSAGANCVDISSATAAAYLVTNSDVGYRLRSEVTASEFANPTPPGGGDPLTWTPPGYPSYSGYQQRTIDATHLNHTVTPGTNVDAVFNWTEVIGNASAENRIIISGFRNVVIIGGERNNSTAAIKGNAVGIQIDKCNGIVHLEGIKIYGPGISDALVCTSGTESGGKQGADIRVQNCYFRNNTINQDALHPDGFQIWGDPGGGFNGGCRSLKSDRWTIHSTFQGIFLGTHSGVIESFDLRNSNIVGVPRGTNGQKDGMGWIFFKGCYPDVGGFYGTGTVTNFYIDNSISVWNSYTNMVTPNAAGSDGSSGQGCHRADNPVRVCTTGVDGTGTYITWANAASDIKGKMYIDRPPLSVGGLASSPSTALGDTDFCPPTVPGLNYVSPGYV